METTNHGENPDAVSPSISKPTALSATQQLRLHLLGDYKGKLPKIDWKIDGNIFSIVGTLQRSWRKTDKDVAQRLQALSGFAMTGTFPASAGISEQLEAKCRDEIEGYDELLSFCLSLSVVDYDGDDDDDLGGLEEDFPDDSDDDE